MKNLRFIVLVSLYEKINELESKKQSLLDEMEKENKGSPAEERERLLKQVQSDVIYNLCARGTQKVSL